MISLQVADCLESKKFVKETIEKYHSYVPNSSSVGRRIDWVVYYQKIKVGMIGIGSSVYPAPKDILNYLSMDLKTYKGNFNSFANNWRFCMREHIKNAGTQILKQMRNLAPVEWKKKYGNDLKHIITFVGGDRDGAVYKADNWSFIGKTAGLPKHKSVSMKWNNKEELKKLYVKPTGENKKLIFIKSL